MKWINDFRCRKGKHEWLTKVFHKETVDPPEPAARFAFIAEGRMQSAYLVLECMHCTAQKEWGNPVGACIRLAEGEECEDLLKDVS